MDVVAMSYAFDQCCMEGCRRNVQRRGMCWKHYQRRRRMADESNAHQYASTPLGPCRCDEPIIGVARWFGWGSNRYIERDPVPGDIVECRVCCRPIAEFLSR